MAWRPVGVTVQLPDQPERHEPNDPGVVQAVNEYMQPRDKFFTALMALRAAGSTQSSNGVEVVQAARELDATGMESLRSAVMCGAQRGNWTYVLDLTAVKAMDSPGLGMLVSALRSIRDLGGLVGLVTDSPRLQRILELCARDRSCRIYNRLPEALKALTEATQPKTAA